MNDRLSKQIDETLEEMEFTLILGRILEKILWVALLCYLIVAFHGAANAQSSMMPTTGNDDDRAYCKYLDETAKAQVLQYRAPSFSSGVTQPNSGTAPQTYVGLTGSLANLRKAPLTSKLALENCKLYTAQDAVDNNVKYAFDALGKDANIHKVELIGSALHELDTLIANANQQVEAHTTTKFAVYALVTAKQQLLAERSQLQALIAGTYVPYMDPTPLSKLVNSKQGFEESAQAVQAKLNHVSNWDVQWEGGYHKTVSSSNSLTLGGNTSGAYVGVQATYNLGAHKVNKHFDAAAKAYDEWKRIEATDVVQGSQNIQAQVADAVVATERRQNDLKKETAELEKNYSEVKNAETNIGQTFLSQLAADRVLLKVESKDAEWRHAQLTQYLAYNFGGDIPEFTNGLVSLTFDDGFVSQFNVAKPILDKAGMKGTFYIVTDYLGMPNYMTAPQMLALANDGQEIGSHTLDHKHLSTLSLADQKTQIGGSITAFMAMGLHPKSFAYPFGERNDDSYTALKDAGFQSARTVDYTLSGQDPYQLAGFPLSNRTTFGQVKVAIDKARREGSWLILIFHRVDEKAENEININHELLQQIVDYLKQTNTEVVTVEQGMQRKASAVDTTKKAHAAAAATKPLF